MNSYTYFLNTSNCVVLYLSVQAASECINEVNDAFFNNGTHDCTLLLDKTDSDGVYVNRASICADIKTKCCPACKQVIKVNHIGIKGIYLSKALTCMKFFLYIQKCFLFKETDTFGHIVVWTIYRSHINHFTPKHTAFEQSAACLSVFLESLPGLVPFAILWHAGWTLEKPVAWTWTTIIRLQYLEVFSPKCTNISGRKLFSLLTFQGQNEKL